MNLAFPMDFVYSSGLVNNSNNNNNNSKAGIIDRIPVRVPVYIGSEKNVVSNVLLDIWARGDYERLVEIEGGINRWISNRIDNGDGNRFKLCVASFSPSVATGGGGMMNMPAVRDIECKLDRCEVLAIGKDLFSNGRGSIFQLILEVMSPIVDVVEDINRHGYFYFGGDAEFEGGELAGFEVDSLNFSSHGDGSGVKQKGVVLRY